jgi:hypothetical protein
MQARWDEMFAVKEVVAEEAKVKKPRKKRVETGKRPPKPVEGAKAKPPRKKKAESGEVTAAKKPVVKKTSDQ